MVKQLPNLMTCGNLFCGCLAIVNIFHGRWDHVAILIILASILDFADGFVARLVSNQSEFGKQLDSLADMITFGVVPALVMYHLMLKSQFLVLYDNQLLYRIMKYYMFIIAVFSGLRLAKFNIDTRQSNYFIGLPTPANTLLIISFAMMVYYNTFGVQRFLLNPWMLVGIASLSSWLLIAEIPLIALKFKNLSWAKNKAQYILLIFSLVMIPLLKFAAIPAIIISYILLSLLIPPVAEKASSNNY